MCTFENEHRVLVCDIAIHQVREVIGAAFGDVVHFTPSPGQGTLVEVPPTVDEEAFQKVARTAIAAAQEKPRTHPNQDREDGMTELGAIKDPERVATLVTMVLQAPVDQNRQGGNRRYFLTFHLVDGTVVTRAYWLDTGEDVDISSCLSSQSCTELE